MVDNNTDSRNLPDEIASRCLECPKGAEGACEEGGCASCVRACHEPPRGKLYATNWLDGISDASDYEMVEVQFKNTRKGYYRNSARLDLHLGDMVAVEASPGHDVGEVTMVGKLVGLQIRKANLKPDHEFKRIFRIARPSDLEKFAQAKAREQETMIRSRKIAEELNLNMKIGDVEYQGDGAKAIFYYIADERVDFRKLIRVLADTFHVRIEMKQIGARQEAGRIGGIGPCGRPLCCSSWMTGFVSVATSAARFQDLSMNPQKLAGQCAKLKCCLNFEVDTYMEASKSLPPRDVPLETKDATYYHFKSDILSGEMTYSTDKHVPVNCVTIPARRVAEIIALNKNGEKVDALSNAGAASESRKEFVDLVGQENINRFDKSRKRRKKKPSQQGAPQHDRQAKAEGRQRAERQQPRQEGAPKREGRQRQPRKPKDAAQKQQQNKNTQNQKNEK